MSFTIICNKCGSKNCDVDANTMFEAIVECNDCGYCEIDGEPLEKWNKRQQELKGL